MEEHQQDRAKRAGTSMIMVACVGLLTAVPARSVEAVAEDGGAKRLGTVYGGYQTAEYSIGNADMGVDGIYLGGGACVYGDWLELDGSIGYSIGNADDLGTALVSDLETVHINLVLKPTYHIKNLSIYGKAGLNYTTVFYSVGWGAWSTMALGGVVGGGASYNMGSRFGLHAEVLSYIGTDSIDYDGPSDGSAPGSDIEYSTELRIGASVSF